MIGFLLLLFIFFILLEGFFSGSEIALVSANRVKVLGMAKEGHRGANLLIDFYKNPERLLSTTLIGTNLSVVTSTTIFTYTVLNITSANGLDEWRHITLLFLVPFILIFGEMTPKTIFRRRADRWAPYLVQILLVISKALFPLTFSISSIARKLARLENGKEGYLPLITKEELRSLLQIPKFKEIEPFEKSLLYRVTHFSEKTVHEVMIPLVDVKGVEEEDTIDDALKVFLRTGHSRLVTYKDRIDHITGILTSFNLFHISSKDVKVKSVKEKARYVPETMRIVSLLKEMKENNLHLVVVVDEYGGASGIVTIEDILEEVVGEIEDEFDEKKSPNIILKGPDTYLLQGRTQIMDLKMATGVDIPEGDYETIAGFILEKLGRIPNVNQVLEYENLSFLIVKASERTVDEVLMIIKRAEKKGVKS